MKREGKRRRRTKQSEAEVMVGNRTKLLARKGKGF